MEKLKKGSKKFLIIAIALLLISMIGAYIVQTNAGNVEIKDIRFETTTGYRMSGLLFIPSSATPENPAPAVVVSHGFFNNREMQDLNYVELSRRGFVVFSMDMYSHGHSDNTTNIGGLVGGMYEAVKMMDTLNYVDSSRIGVTGHSMGGAASSTAVIIDGMMPHRLISSALLNVFDPTTVDDEGNFANVYGSADVGVLAAQYEELPLMRDIDAQGNVTPPREYVYNRNAQSFLHFGVDPAGLEMRQPDTMYRQIIDGEEAIRIIYFPRITHPWSHFSQRSTVHTIDFFETTLNHQSGLSPSNQIWQLKAFFNSLGLIGVTMFLVSFAVLMVFTPFFSSLRAKEPVAPVPLEKKGVCWFWGCLTAGALFGTLLYFPILTWAYNYAGSVTWIQQDPPFAVGMWAFFCGLFAIVLMVFSYLLYGKKNGVDLKARGVTMSLATCGKTILLALIVLTVSYGWVFVADFFFKVDFRLWVLALRTFEVDKVIVAIFPYSILYLTFYVANSVAVNSFNYNDIGKKGWVNTCIIALFNALPPLVLILVQYITLRITGFKLLSDTLTQTIGGIWLFPVLIFLPVTAILARKIYRATNNPYLPGIVNGLLVTLIAAANTATGVAA